MSEWATEAQRRAAELDAGEVPGVDFNEVIEQAKRRVR